MSGNRFTVAFALTLTISSASFAQPNPPIGGKIAEDVKSLNLDIPLKVGSGFDPGGFRRKDSPFENPQAVPDQGGPRTNVELFYATTSKGLYQAAGFDMRVTVRTPFGSGGFDDHKLSIAQITEGKAHLVIVVTHSYGSDSLPASTKLTARAAALLESNPREFGELYGTHFVKSQERIARIVYILTTDKWSEKTVKEAKTSAEADGGFGGWGGGLALSMRDDLKDRKVRNSLSVTAHVTGGGNGVKTAEDIIKAAVVVSDADGFDKSVGNAVATLFENHRRENAGPGAMVMQSYRTIGWKPELALLWSDAYEDKLKECAKLLTDAEALKKAIDTTRLDQGIPLTARDELAALSRKYDGYAKALREHGRKLIEKDEAALKKPFPDTPRIEPSTEAALFKRYAGILERLERLETEKNDTIEIRSLTVTPTAGKPATETFEFEKKHKRFEAFVTDIDLKYLHPNGTDDGVEIHRMIATARAEIPKEPTSSVKVEYNLLMRHPAANVPQFKGSMRLVVIGY